MKRQANLKHELYSHNFISLDEYKSLKKQVNMLESSNEELRDYIKGCKNTIKKLRALVKIYEDKILTLIGLNDEIPF